MELDGKETYTANIMDFIEKGKDWNDLNGHDKQKILPLKDWRKV
jgi:hypothetical protein